MNVVATLLPEQQHLRGFGTAKKVATTICVILASPILHGVIPCTTIIIPWFHRAVPKFIKDLVASGTVMDVNQTVFSGTSPEEPMWRCFQGCDYDLCATCMMRDTARSDEEDARRNNGCPNVAVSSSLETITIASLLLAVEEDAHTTTNNNPASPCCVVCLSAPPSTAFIPCGHLAVCSECCHQIMNPSSPSSCPICRQPVLSTQRIFTT